MDKQLSLADDRAIEERPMQIIDLEMSKDLSDAFFNPRASSLFRTKRPRNKRPSRTRSLWGQCVATRIDDPDDRAENAA